MLTVKLTAALVVCVLLESVATAVKLWLPLATVVEFQFVEYGDDPVTGEPILVPSIWNCTEDIVAGLVAAAVAVRVTAEPDTVDAAEGAVMDIVGGGLLEALEPNS